MIENKPKDEGREKAFRIVTLVALAGGVVLRTVHWMGRPSLWLDEANLAQAIIHTPVWELLTEPLGWAQVAPLGFLLLERGAFRAFGPGEMALGLVPFIASILALVFFWSLARKVLAAPGAFIAVAVMAMNPFLISLGGAVKQYSSDALVTVLLLVISVRVLGGTEGGRRAEAPGESTLPGHPSPDSGLSRKGLYLLAGIAGMLAFLSIPSAMVAISALIALSLPRDGQAPWNVEWWKRRAPPLALWSLLAGVAGLREKWIVDRRWGDFMHEFWGERGSFLPSFLDEPLALLNLLRWQLVRPAMFQPYPRGGFNHGPLVDSQATLAVLLLMFGIGALWLIWKKPGRRWQWVALAWGPFLFAILLARLGVYPLDARVDAFLIPLVALILGSGMDGVLAGVTSLARRTGAGRPAGARASIGFRAALSALPVLFLLPFGKVLVDRPPPYVILPVRGVLEGLAQERAGNEPVYGFWYSGAIFGYYGPRFGLEEGVQVATGGDLRANYRELAAYRGEATLWIVFPHSYGPEKEAALCFLATVGREERSRAFTSSGWNHLLTFHRFDLSDLGRWEGVDVEAFPVEGLTYPDCGA